MDVRCATGAIGELPRILDELGYNKIFLVTGRKSFQSSGAETALASYLEKFCVTRFSDIDENPKIEQLEQGLQQFDEAEPGLIIGVGGGSVLDMAKLIKIFSGQAKPVLHYVEGRENLSPVTLPLVAIPTTAGSGSQATHFAVLYVGKTKHSVADRCMLPDVSIVDANLLASVPKRIAASTGLDALNQGIESYWSIHSTTESMALASEAIDLAWKNLQKVVSQPDAEARQAMALAAHRAGEAINITKTTAPHAISYPITSYFGVPHGHAVGLILSAMFVYNASVTEDDCLDSRGAKYARDTMNEIATLMGVETAVDAAAAYDSLMDSLGLSRNFQALGIKTRDDLETIISNGFNPQRVNNNPRRVTATALREMLIELQG